MNFIKNNNNVTTNSILNLDLLYLRLSSKKKDTEIGAFPIAYYGLDCFNKYDCHLNEGKILEELSSKDKIDKLYRIYYMTTFNYTKYYTKEYNTGYNTMIKQAIEYNKLEEYYTSEKERENLDF